MIKNRRVNTFLGLNNMLNPASDEYAEGMAWRSKDARIDESGLWSPRRALINCSSAPGLITAWGTGNHFKNLAIENTDKIIKSIATTECVDTGPNNFLYGTTGSGAVTRQKADATKTSCGTYTPPTGFSVAETNGATSRAENGTYYYMCTYFDNVYKRESLPSTVDGVEIDHDDGAKDCVTVTIPEASSDQRVRIYRTLRICSAEGIYNATNIFYFVAEKTSGTSHVDYMHDDDIMDSEYEGRGGAPPEAVDYLAAYNNRMLYFKGNIVYWSSAGRPDEVAAEYTITYQDSPSDTVKCKPKLSLGVYGEAKFEIAELSGQKILAAMLKDGKLWLWTASMTGYLKATNRLEGYRFKVVRKGIGVTSDKVLAYTPYGIFGADRQGIWLLDNADRIRRLSESVIDIHKGTDTAFTQANITSGFGVWIPTLNEYWWSVNNVQIVYQANRGIFAGPYTYSLTGGTSFVSAGGAQAYLTGGKTPSMTTIDTGSAQYFEFWLGQSLPNEIKDEVEVEITHSDSVGNATVTLYQNSIPSETGATSGAAISYNASSIGKVVGTGSGRFFKVKLSTNSGRWLTAINYKYEIVE